MADFQDYRDFIQIESPRLNSVGLKLCDENASSMTFEDNLVSITFYVEPHSQESLNAYARYLTDYDAEGEVFDLDLLMEMSGLAKPNLSDKKHHVKAYVDFIMENKKTLFQTVCPLKEQYRSDMSADEDRFLAKLMKK